MCASCQNKQVSGWFNQSVPRGARVTPTDECKEPLSFYTELDTTGWNDLHKAMVRSQIAVYSYKCNLYHDAIKAAIEYYSPVLPN